MSTIATATPTEPTITTPATDTIVTMSNLMLSHTAVLQGSNMLIRWYNHMAEEHLRRIRRIMAREETISSRTSSLTTLSYTIITTLIWRPDYKTIFLIIASLCFLYTLINSIFRWRNNFDLFGNRREFFVRTFALIALVALVGLFLWFFLKPIDSIPDFINRIINVLLLVVCINFVAAAVTSQYIFNETEISQRSSTGIFDDIQDSLLVFWVVYKVFFGNLKAKILCGWELLSSLLQNGPVL